MTTQELIQTRLNTGKIYAEDIKHKERLSASQIRGISTTLAYEWIRTGKWKKKDFEKWLSVKMNQQEIM